MPNGAYCVRAEGGTYAQAFKDGGYAAIGWMSEDLSSITQVDMKALGDRYDAAYPKDGKLRRAQNLGQISRFVWEIEPGDVVITPTHRSEYLLIGTVESPYYYEVTPDVHTAIVDALIGRMSPY